MCAWMDVSTSGFYEWRDRPTSATARRRARLATLIEWIFNDSDHTYGHRRIHAALHRQGERLTPELVRSIMRELGLIPCQPRPFRPTTTVAGDPGVIPDLLTRDFHADAPGTKLVGDITYLPTWEGWLYLATVIDCHTRVCIGYALAGHMRADLVIDALQMAARNYPLADDAIFHSDRGTQGVPGLRRTLPSARGDSVDGIGRDQRRQRARGVVQRHAQTRDLARWARLARRAHLPPRGIPMGNPLQHPPSPLLLRPSGADRLRAAARRYAAARRLINHPVSTIRG